jgi:hypothetical protein
MQIYVWRHNRSFHSYSMISEPCVHQDMYMDAVAIVLAHDLDEALRLLAERDGWRVEDLRRLAPRVYSVDEATVLFADARG